MIFASDLDRTLVHPLKTVPPERAGEVEVVEVFEGRAITCMSPRSLDLLRQLAAACTFVPTTTRSQAQYERLAPIVALASDYAVCANGGTVLHRGEPDAGWAAQVSELVGGCGAIDEVRATLASSLGEASDAGWRLRERDCDGLFLYSVCDLALTPDDAEAAARDAVEALGWTAHLHGRKLYVLPSGLTKARAVDYIRTRLGDDGPVVAAGDSELDRVLLEYADVAYCPGGSELTRALEPLPAHVRVTSAEHVGAAEELLADALGALVSR